MTYEVSELGLKLQIKMDMRSRGVKVTNWHFSCEVNTINGVRIIVRAVPQNVLMQGWAVINIQYVGSVGEFKTFTCLWGSGVLNCCNIENNIGELCWASVCYITAHYCSNVKWCYACIIQDTTHQLVRCMFFIKQFALSCPK